MTPELQKTEADNCDAQSGLSPAPLLGGWRDMATAPKGEAILVYHILGGHNIARWNSDSYSKKPNPYWDIGSPWGKRQQQVINPMAWMPLPEPPNIRS